MLTQDIILQYLNSGQPIKLPNFISDLLSEASQLTLEDRIGLLVASFILGGACWSSSVKMIRDIAPIERVGLHSAEVAVWIIANWEIVEDLTPSEI
jgi:hypothetical protein